MIGILSLALLLAGCGDVINSSNAGENSSSENATSSSNSTASSSNSESSSSENSSSSEQPSSSENPSSSDGSSSSDSSSSSSSSKEEEKTISLETALSDISKLQKEELDNAASVQYSVLDGGTSVNNYTDQTYTNYLDGSTTSEGTYSRVVDGSTTVNDTFRTIATRIIDVYEDEEDSTKTNSFDMFVKVTDYDKPWNSPEAYQDSASKQFIVNSEEEAAASGLSSSQYILNSDFELNAAANLSAKLYNYVAGDIASNAYAEQAGANKFVYTVNDEGNITYNLDCNYSYDEDGQRISGELKVEYTVNKEKTRLLSYETSTKTTYTRINDSSDTAYSILRQSGSITYGNKTEAFGSDVIDPNEYFLSNVSELQLKAKDVNWKINDVGDDKTVSATTSTIYGYAKTYEPTKALYTELTPYATSNEDIVKIETYNGSDHFEVVAAGTVDLTFCYYARRESGVYYLNTIKYEGLIVKDIAIESLNFSPVVGHKDTSMLTGQTYTFRYYTSPSKAITEEVEATSSREKVATVKVTDSGEIEITALSQGEVTITLASKKDPTIKTEKTFYVINSKTRFANFLTSNTFLCDKYKNIYGYTVTLAFSSDGTCTRTTTQTDGTVTTDTFSWELVGNEFELDDYSSSWRNWDEGRISSFYDSSTKEWSLGLTLEYDGDLSTMEFYVVK